MRLTLTDQQTLDDHPAWQKAIALLLVRTDAWLTCLPDHKRERWAVSVLYHTRPSGLPVLVEHLADLAPFEAGEPPPTSRERLMDHRRAVLEAYEPADRAFEKLAPRVAHLLAPLGEELTLEAFAMDLITRASPREVMRLAEQ